MTTCRPESFLTKPGRFILNAAFALLVPFTTFAMAQESAVVASVSDPKTASTRLDLPDAPGFVLSDSSSSRDAATGAPIPDDAFGQTSTVSRPKGTTHMKMVINPGEVAGPMTVRDKVVHGMTNSVSLYSAAGWFASAGWEHMWNGSPNYGTDSGAFGERLGAAALRGISEGVFSNSLFAPLFHEDPRYYVMGRGHSFFKRAFYAGTRTIITRTDSGSKRPNFSLLAGNFAGSALTVPYYPPLNTSFKEVCITFGGSIGGSAVGFVVDEFIVDALVDLHLKKQPPQP